MPLLRSAASPSHQFIKADVFERTVTELNTLEGESGEDGLWWGRKPLCAVRADFEIEDSPTALAGGESPVDQVIITQAENLMTAVTRRPSA